MQKTEHQWSVTTIAPECDTNGYDYHICTVCRASYQDNYKDNLGHDYSKVVILNARTCTKNAYGHIECSRCGDWPDFNTYLVGPEYDALGHDYGEPEITSHFSCTTDEIVTKTCRRDVSVCDPATRVQSTVTKTHTGHNINGTGKTELGEVKQGIDGKGARTAAVCLPDSVLKISSDTSAKFAYYCVNPWCDVETEGASGDAYAWTENAEGKAERPASKPANAEYHWIPVEDHARFDLASAALVEKMETELGKNFEGKADVFKAADCTFDGWAQHVCPVCYTIEENIDSEVEREVLPKLGHTFDREGYAPEFQIDGKTKYAPCQPDDNLRTFTKYKKYLTANGLTEEFRNTVKGWSEYPSDESGVAGNVKALVEVATNKFATVCTACGALQQTEGHVYEVYKYTADENGAATNEREHYSTWEEFQASGEKLTCWYAVECKYYTLCHSTAGDASHSPAKANNKELYENCRHGTYCTECHKQLTVPTGHKWLDLKSLTDKTSDGYKLWVAAAEKNADFKAILDPEKVLRKASCKAGEEGYAQAQFCEYCLAAIAEGATDVDLKKLVKYDPNAGETPPAGTVKTEPTQAKDGKTYCGYYQIEVAKHTWQNGYVKGEDMNETVFHYFIGDKEVFGREIDCLSVDAVAEECGNCGEYLKSATAASKLEDTVRNTSDDSKNKTLADGKYAFTKGSHVVALIKDYENSKYYKAPTCVNVATLPLICVRCGLQLNTDALQTNFEWATANDDRFKNVEKADVSVVTGAYTEWKADETVWTYESAKFDTDKEYKNIFLTLNPENHEKSETEMEHDGLECMFHCEAESTTLTYEQYRKIIGEGPDKNKYSLEGHATYLDEAPVTCKGDLDHKTIVIEYVWSEKDPYRQAGFTVELLKDGVTEVEKDGKMVKVEKREDGFVPAIQLTASRCQSEGGDWKLGVEFDLLIRPQIVLKAADGTVINGGDIKIFKESTLNDGTSGGVSSLLETTPTKGSAMDDKDKTDYVGEPADGFKQGTVKVVESDTFFFIFDDEKKPAASFGIDQTKKDELKGLFAGSDKDVLTEGYYQFAENAKVQSAWTNWAVATKEDGTPDFDNPAEIVIDLNGGVYTSTKTSQIILPGTSVTIKNGVISYVSTTADNTFYASFGVAGTLILENVTFVSNTVAIEVYPGATLELHNSTVIGYIEGINITDEKQAGKYGDEEKETFKDALPNVTIENSTVASLAGQEISNSEENKLGEKNKTNYFQPFNGITMVNGNLTIKGSTVIGSAHAVEMNGGTLTAEDSKFIVGIPKTVNKMTDADKIEGSWPNLALEKTLDKDEDGNIKFEDHAYLGKKNAEGEDVGTEEFEIKDSASVYYFPAAAEDRAAIYVNVESKKATAFADVKITLKNVTIEAATEDYDEFYKVYFETEFNEESSESDLQNGNLELKLEGTTLTKDDVVVAARTVVKCNGSTLPTLED